MTEPVAATAPPPPVDLTRLEQLAERITPGLWWSTEAIGDDEDAFLIGVERPDADDGYAIIVSTPGDASFAIEPTNRAADAEFIAALRNAAPQLLADHRAVERVRALHAFLGHGRGFCSHCAMAWPCPTVAALDGSS